MLLGVRHSDYIDGFTKRGPGLMGSQTSGHRAGGVLRRGGGAQGPGHKEGLGLELGKALASQCLLSRLDVSRQSGQRDRRKQVRGW